MRPLRELKTDILSEIEFVLTDIDDTLTLDGRISAAVYSALEKLHNVGIKIIPITGRPAGWCDHIARMWPVDGVVGENGAFYFCYRAEQRKMIRRYWKSATERQQDRAQLSALSHKILAMVPEVKVAADQLYRETDLAIDVSEDVAPLPAEKVNKVVEIFAAAGANAKISSIHVNGWFGEYDKLNMTRKLFAEIFDQDLEAVKERVIFIGDSPNDMPMFDYFPNAVGVANVLNYLDRLSEKPAWITKQAAGFGFIELAEAISKAKPGS